MNNKQRKAIKKLDRAFEYLRPRMQGDSIAKVPRNNESYAGSFLTHCMELVIHDAYMNITMGRS